MNATDTNTKVANRALNAVGSTTVLSDLDTDTSTQAKVVRRVYDDCVLEVLQAIDWNFNSRRVKLAEYSQKPAFDFAYQYVLPSDCLKVRDVFDTGGGTAVATGYEDEYRLDRRRWVVETAGDTDQNMVRVLACDIAAPLPIIYSRSVFALPRWSPLARKALIACVAKEIAMPVTQKRSIAQDAETKYEMIIAKASGRDAQEASETYLDSGGWVQARW